MDIKLEGQELDIKEMSSLINRLRFDNDALLNIIEELRKENEKLKKENSNLKSQIDEAVVGLDRVSHMGCYEVSREVSIRLDKIRQIRREGE